MKASSLIQFSSPIFLFFFLVSSSGLANTGKSPNKKDKFKYPQSKTVEESPEGVKSQNTPASIEYRQVVDSPGAYQVYDEGLKLQEAGEGAEAAAKFQSYAKQYPQGQYVDSALLSLGQYAFQQSRFTEADSYYSRLIQLSPPSRIRGEAILGQAQSRYAQGQRKDALALLSKVDSREVRSENKMPLFSFWAKLSEEEGKILESVLASLKVYRDATGPTKKSFETQIEKKIRDQLNEAELNYLYREYPSGFPVPLVQIRLATISMAKGNHSSAKNLLNAVISNHPGTRYATQAQSLLSRADSAQSIIPTKIGLLIPQSGPLANVGKKFFEGFTLAMQKFAPQLEYVVTDPGPSIETAGAAFEKLVFEERVAAILGPFASSQVEAVASKASDFGVPLLTLSARDRVLEKSASIFRIGMTPQKQVRALVGYAKEKIGAARFAILFPEDAFGKEYAEEFFKAVEEQGAVVTAAESYSPGQNDFLTQIQNMTGIAFPGFRRTEAQDLVKALELRLNRVPTKKELEAVRVPPIVDFDVLFLPDTYKTLGQIVPALLYADVTNVKLLGPSSWNNFKLLERTGQYLENSYFVDFFSAERASKVTKAFVDAYQSKFAFMPDSMAGAGYDLGLSLAMAYQKGKPETRDELRSYLETLGSIEGALGLYDWNSKRDALSELQVFSIRRNAFQHQGGILLKSE